MKQFVDRLLVVLLLELVTSLSLAQSDAERAGARAAAEQGVKAFNEGRWSESVDLMTRAEKLVHAPTHLLFLAQAQEKLGHLVTAHEIYLRIAREKLRADAPEAFLAAQESAKQAEAALRSRLVQVSIVLQGNNPKSPVEVTMDGERVPDALLGVPHPVDPGAHELVAKGEAMQSRVTSIQLREGSTETIVLKLEPVAGGAALSSPVSPPKSEPPLAERPSSGVRTREFARSTGVPIQNDAKNTGSGMKVLGYTGLGVGVIGVGVGTAFLLRSLGKRADANALCNLPAGDCPDSKASQINQLDSSANSAGNIATVGFLIGGLSAATGAALLILSPKQEQNGGTAAWVAPYVGASAAGIVGGF